MLLYRFYPLVDCVSMEIDVKKGRLLTKMELLPCEAENDLGQFQLI